jgi:Ca2+-binding RTX toxin-like protein
LFLFSPDDVGLVGGELVVAWHESASIRARIFEGGTPGSEIVLSSTVHSANPQFSIAALEDGGFVCVWAAFDVNSVGTITSRFVLGQTYNADGSARGSEFVVTPGSLTGGWRGHAVTGLEDGGFAISWSDQTGTHFQRYDADRSIVEDTVYTDLPAPSGFAPGSVGATIGTSIVQLDDGNLLIISNGGSESSLIKADLYGRILDDEPVTPKALVGSENSDAFIGSPLGDTMDGSGGADFLTGLEGNDIFVFRAGEADGDVVTDFEGAASTGGDVIHLSGYSAGAEFFNAGGDWWTISQNGATETIQLVGITQLGVDDYVFT